MDPKTVSIGFIVFGTIWVLATIIFKQQINTFYNRFEYKSEKEKWYYKTIAIKLPGIVFYFLGTFFYITTIQNLEEQVSTLNGYHILGYFTLGFGIITAIFRLAGKEQLIFSKIDPSKKTDWAHILEFTILPTIIGIFLLLS